MSNNFCAVPVAGFLRLHCAIFCLLVLSLACTNDGGSSYMQKSEDGRTGSKFFIAEKEDIVLDKDTGLDVVKDVINITFAPSASGKTVKKIVSSVNGTIVGYDYAVNFYQIRIQGSKLQATKTILLDMLGNFKEIESASICPVSAHKDPFYVK